MPQAHPLQQLLRTLGSVPPAIQLQRQHDIFQGIEAVEQLEGLEHETDLLGAQGSALVFVQGAEGLTGQQHLAATGQIQPGQQTQQGGFSRAGSAHDRHAGTALNFQTDVVEDGQLRFRGIDDFAKVAGNDDAV